MDCNAVERAIVEHGVAVPEAVHEHLRSCPSCQEFARVQQVALSHVPDAAPSPTLDQAVLAAGHRRLRRGWRRLPAARAWYRAAAAALLLAGGLGLWLRQRPPTAPSLGGAPGADLVVQPRHWAGAQVDLEAIEGGLEAALAEMGTLGTPARGADAEVDSQERWDALTELEFDVYFESEALRQGGG